MSSSGSEIMIAPTTTKRIKLSESENEDRLSDLPESVILHILSFLNAKHAIQTCLLSIKWKNIWKRLPILILNSDDYRTYKIFTKFVSTVLSLRDSSVALQVVDLRRQNGRLELHILERIVNYAISHNVQQLGLYVDGDIAQIPTIVFSCQTLTHLKLSIYNGIHNETMFPRSLSLPALTNLQLEHFTFCVGDNDRIEPFSTFNRLNSLCISNCTVRGVQTLCISSATLVDLTLYDGTYNFYKIDLCTPCLCTFVFTGTPYQKISGSNVSSLKHVDIDADMSSYPDEPPLFLFSWLLEFGNIQSLTVSAATLQVLYLLPNLLEMKLPSLGNLKSLRVIMKPLEYEFRKRLCQDRLRKVKSKKEATRLIKEFEPSPLIPDGIVNFLLQNSPSAEVGYIDYERLPRRATNL
ncbi:hypothetical protein TSUD_304180 [Trifolium subterraneum]|uniref:F-box domain-containing protein n=1 Tax=Trifolium subterraneum TaxID=3900 RepID=A0A2Z6M0V3_TRISU|nr:hypothetical protein TSUD_304180 [Trifolium subterraneum]